MKIIGITGQIGAGKTYVAALMAERVQAHINTDTVYHTLIAGPSECTEKIREYFGESVIAPNGGVDRKALGEIVFHDKEKLKKLNEITHVCVGKRTKEILSQMELSGEKAVIVEVPLMFESGFDKLCDAVVCVTADIETRITRIMERSGLTRDEAEMRISNQNPTEFYLSNSDFTVYNNGSEDLNVQIKNILKQILSKND